MAPFGGWEMPLYFSSILEETKAVRSEVGLFDVSHMGLLEISGGKSDHLVNRIISSDVTSLYSGKSRYTLICNLNGGIIDDCILYKLDDNQFLLVTNAANTRRVSKWFAKWDSPKTNIHIRNQTRTSILALQGPNSPEILSTLFGYAMHTLKPYHHVSVRELPNSEIFVARTGYTGEDGFELYIPNVKVLEIWSRLITIGVKPCGLGSRDVLRLEAGLPLHGNEIDTTVNPYESNLGKFVDLERSGYIAAKALRKIHREDTSNTLVGFTVLGRKMARKGHQITYNSNPIGSVTSGTYSPTLDTSIGMGYVPRSCASPGFHFQIDIRGHSVDAEVTKMPFYSRKN